GDSCVAEGIVPCGSCASCQRGATNTCEIYDEHGFTREGGAGDQIVVSAELVHMLGESVALVEPAAVVLCALEKARPAPDARVVIVGDGTIALLAAHLIRLWRPREVIVVGRRPEQDSLALQAGATCFSTVDADADGADLAIEAAGTTAAMLT